LATKSEIARVNGNTRRGEQHPLAKLTAEQVREIRTLDAAGRESHTEG
jgi:hypothetical protein